MLKLKYETTTWHNIITQKRYCLFTLKKYAKINIVSSKQYYRKIMIFHTKHVLNKILSDDVKEMFIFWISF